MSQHLEREIGRLKKRILTLGAEVENSLRGAVRALLTRDSTLATNTIDADSTIDQLEVDIEEDCLKILALHQPVAIDLRYIIATLKINNDLERIGDLAVNIAERADALSKVPPVTAPFDLGSLAEKVQLMVRRSLDSLVDFDLSAAQDVLVADDEVDQIHRAMYGQVRDAICNNLENTDSLIQLLAVSRNLERVADHATNIAEDVIYLIEGQIARHGLYNHRANGSSHQDSKK